MAGAPSLVVQTAFIGDMVLTTPLIAELATRSPVDVVGTPANISLLANNPHVRNAIAYDKRGAGALGRFIDIGRRLRRDRYEAAYLAQGSIRSAALAVVAGIRSRVGFETAGGRYLYTVRVPYEQSSHHSERLLRLALQTAPRSDLSQEALRPRLYPGDAERSRVDTLLREIPPHSGPLVALAPGSVWATKRWPYYPELAALVRERARIVIIGSPADRPLAEAIRVRVPDAVDAAGRLSLLESAELLGRCAATVSNDSAPVHLASAMNVPTLAVFGPTVPAFGFGPVADVNDVAGHDSLACRPCHRHGPRRCPLGHWRCMGELSADEIFRTLTRLIPAALGQTPADLQ
ncbi:glycosyltransferase family 9 protein [soil metagenome]